MIEEQAVVIAVAPDFATLEIIRNKPCGICGQTRGCGVSLWGRIFSHQSSMFHAKNPFNAKVGDYVTVGINEQSLLLSAFVVYGIPLVTLLLGAVFATTLAPSEQYADRNAVIGALIGLLLGFVWLKGHQQGRSLNLRYQPEILSISQPSVVSFQCKKGQLDD